MLLGAVVFAWPACSRTDEERTVPVARVEVWTVTQEPLRVQRSWTGLIEPLRVLLVQAPRAGVVETLLAQPGDRVEQGKVLVEMAGPDLRARAAGLEARLRILDEELEQWEQLARDDAAGPGEVNAARLRQLEVADLLAEMEAAIEAYRVRAPVTGLLMEVLVDASSYVSEGQVLAQVADLQAMGLRLLLPARERRYLEQRDRLTLRGEENAFIEIDRIIYHGNAPPGFLTANLYLRDGQELVPQEATLSYAATQPAILVPWTAVASDPDRHWVGLVLPGSHQVERRRVLIGRAHPAGVEITDGLHAGDRVIRYQPRSHPEGRPVQPQETGR
jgi:membrane fusion protein, multidrug efflux system